MARPEMLSFFLLHLELIAYQMDELLPTMSVDCSHFKQRRKMSELSQEQTEVLE